MWHDNTVDTNFDSSSSGRSSLPDVVAPPQPLLNHGTTDQPGVNTARNPLLSSSTPSLSSSLSSSFVDIPSDGSSRSNSTTYYRAPQLDRRSIGGKTLGLFSSICLTVNNITGPGMVALPFVYARGGWLVPTFLLVILSAVAALCSVMVCAAIRLVRGNERYVFRIEFATAVQHYFGDKAHFVAQCAYNFALMCKNIASIIVTAQVMDEFLVWTTIGTRAIQLWPLTWNVVEPLRDEDILFQHQGGVVILTVGYVIVLILFSPLGFLNLDENIYFQWASSFALVMLLAQFTDHFVKVLGHHQYESAQVHAQHSSSSNPTAASALPVIGRDFSTMVGVILFSLTYVVTVPSWLNEKRRHVSVGTTIWTSASIALCMYLLIGVLGALAYADSDISANLLEVMVAGPMATNTLKLGVFAFSTGVIGLGIPLFNVMIRYNLQVSGYRGCGRIGSTFWGCAFPWAVAFTLYQGVGFLQFVNWTTLLFSGVINFVVPAVMYVRALDMCAEEEARAVRDKLEARSRWVAYGGRRKSRLVADIAAAAGGKSTSMTESQCIVEKAAVNGEKALVEAGEAVAAVRPCMAERAASVSRDATMTSMRKRHVRQDDVLPSADGASENGGMTLVVDSNVVVEPPCQVLSLWGTATAAKVPLLDRDPPRWLAIVCIVVVVLLVVLTLAVDAWYLLVEGVNLNSASRGHLASPPHAHRGVH